MKKLYTTLFALAFGIAGYSQCTPAGGFSNPGIYPPQGSTFRDDSVYVLPAAPLNSTYNQTINLLIPVDSTITMGGLTITADIDSMRVVGINNMPSWLSYACDNSGCSWLGGDYGCLNFSGTVPSTGNTWLMDAELEVAANLGSFGQVVDTVPVYIEVTAQTVSIRENAVSRAPSVGPNPISDRVSIEYTAIQNQNYHFELMDVTGRMIHSQKGVFTTGKNQVHINRNNWPEGMYLYRLRIDGEIHTGRLVVNNGF